MCIFLYYLFSLTTTLQGAITLRHPPTLLIDGDIILYKATAAVERTITFDGDNYISTGSLEVAKAIVEDSLASFCSSFQTKHYLVALTDSANWRNTIYPPYKANRKGKPRPVCLAALRTYVANTHPTFQRPTLEADDILGILATSTKIIHHPGRKIIISADKDMKSIPGLYYDTRSKKICEIPEDHANRWHMYQTLTGDASDGYPGCPGIGPKKAHALLNKGNGYAEWWPLVTAAYAKAKLTEKDALMQAQISRICRATDYNFKTKEVRLWQPL